MKRAWFEISNAGWRQLNAGRDLASLLHEAIQNAFDQEVSKVLVDLDEKVIRVEDNGAKGFEDPDLVYTVFYSDKGHLPEKRGRYGRGLKELISAMDKALIETVGFSVRFDEDGRTVIPNKRRKGTRLSLHRDSKAEEIRKAQDNLKLVLPPEGIAIRVNGTRIKRPKTFARLSGCMLDTVVYDDHIERIVQKPTSITLFKPRHERDRPHIYEMGLPIERVGTPWHIDVGQRVPLRSGRDRLSERFRLQVLATLFESLVPEKLPEKHLNDSWVLEVISRCKLSDAALQAYVARALPERTVLPTSETDDDRARQEGAHVLDTSVLSNSQVVALKRVMETSTELIDRQERQTEDVRATRPDEQRAVALLGSLAKKILGRPVKIRLVRKTVPPGGTIESATFDRKLFELRINVEGHLDLTRPLSAHSLGIFFHELAHAYGETHDQAFIEHLEKVAGRGAQILMRDGRKLASMAGIDFEAACIEPQPKAPGEASQAQVARGMAHWATPKPVSIGDLDTAVDAPAHKPQN